MRYGLCYFLDLTISATQWVILGLVSSTGWRPLSGPVWCCQLPRGLVFESWNLLAVALSIQWEIEYHFSSLLWVFVFIEHSHPKTAPSNLALASPKSIIRRPLNCTFWFSTNFSDTWYVQFWELEQTIWCFQSQSLQLCCLWWASSLSSTGFVIGSWTKVLPWLRILCRRWFAVPLRDAL